MSVNNVSPQTFLGGTWQPWGAGKVPVGVDTNDTDFNASNKSGGSKTVTLTVKQMPQHTHNLLCGYGDVGNPTMTTDALRYQYWGGNNRGWHNFLTQKTGNNEAHENMPPYLTVYMWQRVS